MFSQPNIPFCIFNQILHVLQAMWVIAARCGDYKGDDNIGLAIVYHRKRAASSNDASSIYLLKKNIYANIRAIIN